MSSDVFRFVSYAHCIFYRNVYIFKMIYQINTLCVNVLFFVFVVVVLASLQRDTDCFHVVVTDCCVCALRQAPVFSVS